MRKTENTGDKPIDYEAWYNAPGNTIRAWDEAHGVTLKRDEVSHELRFEASHEILFPEAKMSHTYPEYFEDRNFENYSTTVYTVAQQELAREALRKCQLYIRNHDKISTDFEGCGLYFYSKTKGSGKTFLSTILGAELNRLGHNIRWYSMPFLLQEIKDGFDREAGFSSSDVINRAKNAEMLMLDDVGVERQTSWVNETIFGILDHRLTLQKPTFFTSNLEPDELAYDERIKDRIKRMTEIIPMPEDCVRKRLSRLSKLGELFRG